MRPFNIIVAVDVENGIGKDGQLPWYLPGDLRNFREITSHPRLPHQQNVVMMGRKTWESIPLDVRPLRNRINVVLTRNRDFSSPKGVLIAKDFEQSFTQLEKLKHKISDIFVIGGQQIFDTALNYPQCQNLYITHILESFDCDTFFNFPSRDFKKVFISKTFTENGISYYFAKYTRN